MVATVKRASHASALPIRDSDTQSRPVTTTSDTIKQKNACASAACETDTAVGNRSNTVTPPSTACSRIATSAKAASRRTGARGSSRQVHKVSAAVNNATVPATMR